MLNTFLPRMYVPAVVPSGSVRPDPVSARSNFSVYSGNLANQIKPNGPCRAQGMYSG